MNLGSYDCAYSTKYYFTAFVTIYQMLMEWNELFVHRGNSWQAIYHQESLEHIMDWRGPLAHTFTRHKGDKYKDNNFKIVT